MDLLLWRHAEAEDGIPDLERALTPRGHKQARRIAEWLKPRLPTQCSVLASPALRTRQTAAALEPGALGIDARLAPGAHVATIIELIARHERDHDRRGALLLVGHQPWVGEVAGTLLTGRAEPLGVRKAALWWFKHHGAGQWSLVAVVDPDLVA